MQQLWSMIASAQAVVQLVMAGLAFASLVNVTVLFAKSYELASLSRSLKSALARISEARSLQEAHVALGSDSGVVTTLLQAAIRELKLSADAPIEQGIKERVSSTLAEIVRAEGRSVRTGMGLLATIGSTAPFVGLFGTVWGIMNSFIGISESHTTNLAVVAPGIAEALLATAFGLVAAIPAVIIYNHFTRATRGYLEQVSRASGAVMRLLSRDFDRSQGRLMGRAAE